MHNYLEGSKQIKGRNAVKEQIPQGDAWFYII